MAKRKKVKKPRIIKLQKKVKKFKTVKSRSILVKKKKKIVKKVLKPKKHKRIKKVKKVKKTILKKKIVKKVKRVLNKKKPVLKKKVILKKKKIKKKKVINTVKKIKKAPVKKRVKKVKKAIIRKIKTPTPKLPEPEFPAETLFKAKIKVIGIGGGGGSIVSEIGRSLEKATFVIADTDIRALKKRPGIKYFWFGENLTHGLGTGVNVDLAKRAAEEAKEKMSSMFEDQDIIIFIASLGGGLGSGATQVFAEAAKEFGGITLGIFTLPFRFEGKNKQRIAQNALKSLRQSLNVSLIIPNEKIFKIIDINTAITEAFSTVNKSLIESLESLIDLIYNPGIINIDFADLRTILKGRGNTAFLNTVEESGKNRAEKICEKVLLNPLLQNSSLEAEKILFNVAGSENLSMFEVEKISRHIADLNPKAKIIFGISKNSKLKSKIKTTILMTGGGSKVEETKAKKAPIKIVTQEKKEEPTKEKIKIEKKEPVVKSKKKKTKPPRIKKPISKKKIEKKEKVKKETLVPFLPIFQNPVLETASLGEKKINIIEATPSESAKKAIRRSGLEVKKAQELEEKKKLQQEKEWEIPAFLRRVKYKS